MEPLMLRRTDSNTADTVKSANILEKALTAIQDADLQYPDNEILECFVREAFDSGAAANYMLQRGSGGSGVLDLKPLLSDWKELIASYMDGFSAHRTPDRGVVADVKRRDGDNCCLSGLKGSYSDPLVVAPILSTTEAFKAVKPSLREMLGIFIGPEMLQRILSGDAPPNDHRNYWVVLRSAARAFSQGFYEFVFNPEFHVAQVLGIGGRDWPSILDKTPAFRRHNLTDHSASGIDTPDVSLLEVASRFAKPVRWTLVARQIAKRESRPATNRSPSPFQRPTSQSVAAVYFTTLCRLLLPAALRVQVYRCLRFIGARLYGPSESFQVQRLPFGMYLKLVEAHRHEGLANEYGTLQLVRRHTHIPVASALDLVSNGSTSCLLTSRLPGIPLGFCIDKLGEDEISTLVSDLGTCLEELRAIPKEVGPDYAITNALGNACLDFRISSGTEYDEERGDFSGPFKDEDEFNKALQMGALPGLSHRGGHRIVFTHGDLNLRNVLVQDGRLSGIVDWENSGWFPEYWDYTKARWVTKLQKRWLKMVDQVFKRFGNFEDELAIERQFWEYCF